MQKGFSLVELSVVLVVIGLFVGGIILGQNLIRAAELRGVSAQMQAYQSAILMFQDEYGGFPGDLDNAVQFWGAQAGGTSDGHDATCAALMTAAVGTETCNGDGDGDIAPNSGETYEGYRAWQHLANAGLVDGSFSGITSDDSNPQQHRVLIGFNVPEGKMSKTGFTIRWYTDQSDDSHGSYYKGNYGNMMWFGTSTGGAYTSANALTPAEAWMIDDKIDDAKPATGWIRTNKKMTDCTTTTSVDTAEYKLSYDDIACGFMLLLEQ